MAAAGGAARRLSLLPSRLVKRRLLWASYALGAAVEDRGAHVYRHFSQNDAWPRRTEHVAAAPGGAAILEATFSNLVPNPPVNDGQFRPFVPEGFTGAPSERSEKRHHGVPFVAVEIGALPWFSPSPSGWPPWPPPKNENSTQRAPFARCPAIESALIVP